MTIKAFLAQLASDSELFQLFTNEPAAACEQAGLNERQCKVVRSGDLQRIRHAIELESGDVAGELLSVVM